MEKQIKKMYMGIIDVHDIDVEKCISTGESMTIVHDGERMVLTPEELVTKRFSISSKQYESKYGNKAYRLMGYKWEPIETSTY
jgi:hypothetical protein